MTLAGRTAIVTGAASGLGRATAVALAAEGAAIVVAGLEPDGLAETAGLIEKEGGRAIVTETDVSDVAAIEAMCERAKGELGPAGILVNDAAIYPYGPWDEMEPAAWDRVFEVNVRAYWLCAKAVQNQMIERGGGSIVNISSITFFTGAPNLMAYVASKGAVVGFTRSLAREVGPKGIRANAIAPGAFPTRATDIHPDQEKLWTTTLDGQCIKRRGEPADVANAVVFLASDASSFITGQTLLVDGGAFLH